jgi:hypothetical protein
VHSELLIAGAVFCFIVGFLAGRYSKAGDAETKRPLQISLDPAAVSAQVEDRLRYLLDDGKRIEAIKELRNNFKLGLKESKDLIDAMESGKSLREVLDLNAPGIERERNSTN